MIQSSQHEMIFERHIMNAAAVYVFRDEACMAFGFTMTAAYFKTMEAAQAYAKNHTFCKVVSL